LAAIGFRSGGQPVEIGFQLRDEQARRSSAVLDGLIAHERPGFVDGREDELPSRLTELAPRHECHVVRCVAGEPDVVAPYDRAARCQVHSLGNC
jgi:hypothetical protein